MHKEHILLNGFRKAKKDFTAGFHVPLIASANELVGMAVVMVSQAETIVL